MGKTKTAYLFTCDETKYNIAPTTATQHVYYAYYRMDIEMELKDYRPDFTWTKIYNKTFYGDKNTTPKTDSKWGLTVKTTETVDDNGTHSGYLTVTQILDAIQNGLTAVGTEGSDDYVPAVQGLDSNGEKAPKTMDQILYIDASDLMSIMEDETVTGTGDNAQRKSHPVSEILNSLDENALLYMPYGSKPSINNVAYNTIAEYTTKDENNQIIKVTPSFRSAGNIVITDRYPFYAPYDIQMDAANKVSYKRLITLDKYGKPNNASVVLPFEITLDNGTHTNTDKSTVTLHTMQEFNSLGFKEGSTNGYFPPVNNVTKAAANTPYLVRLTENSSEDGVSFIIDQPGSLISKTTGMDADYKYPYTLTGNVSNGTLSEGEQKGNYIFTNRGTFAGVEIAKADNVFYFARNQFVSSADLGDGYSTAKVLPFRTFFQTAPGTNAKLTSFRIVFGENDEMGGTNGINDIQRDVDLAMIPGKGAITLMARAQKDVTIHAVSGITVDKCSLNAGETRTISVPAGVYVINGVKMVVK